MRNPTKTIDPEKITKVRTFMEADQRLQNFKAKNYEVFQQFAHLLNEYNDAREDAEKEVRARGVNCGPFTVCGEMSKVDVEKLYDELGEAEFLAVGGTVETKRVLDIDKRKFEALVDSKSIPKEVVDTCYSNTLKYKTPHKAELP